MRDEFRDLDDHRPAAGGSAVEAAAPGPFERRRDGSYVMEINTADKGEISFERIGGLVRLPAELVGRAPGSGCSWEAELVMREEAAFRIWAKLDQLFGTASRRPAAKD